MGTNDLASLLRPEWVFEVSNRLQTCAGDLGVRVAQEVELILKNAPPESKAERRLLAFWLDGARLEKQSRQSHSRNVRDREDGVPPPESIEFRAKPRALVAAARAKSVLDQGYSIHWTVEGLARRVGCNRTDLEKGFQSLGPHTVHSYLTVRRIDGAKSILRTTAWRIDEVGKAVGYRSKVSFYFNFRNTTGMTPDEYRRRWALCPASAPIAELLVLNRD